MGLRGTLVTGSFKLVTWIGSRRDGTFVCFNNTFNFEGFWRKDRANVVIRLLFDD